MTNGEDARSVKHNGIALCLRKLADEAADLGRMTTNAAIRHAAETCLQEAHSAGLRVATRRLN